MSEEGKYIYCIISVKGGSAEAFPRGSIGINDRETSLLPYKDIAAVVSSTPIISFDRLDKKELTRHVVTHQKVNEEAVKDYSVVPMAFGVIAPDIDEVLCILEKAYLQFKTALKNTGDKVEFVVQVRWNQEKLLEELVNANSEIQKLKQRASLKTGILGMPIKLKLGKLIYQEVETCKRTYVKDIQQTLNSLACDFTQNKLIENACPVGSQRLSFVDMIANFSFLIDKARESELDRKMQELGKKYEGKLRFKYIGPMPPYSFTNVNLSLGNFELVNEARKLLELGEEATFDEIKKVYHALAHQYHPDKHQDNPKKEEQMKKIIQAYNVLENYCQSYGQKQKHSFKEEDVKNSLIIK